MDVMMSEHEKRIIRLGINLFRKKIGKKASKENISAYLRETKEPALIDLFKQLDFVTDNTIANYQKKYMPELFEFMLFLAVNNEQLKIAFEGLLTRFTKYEKVKIDLKPCLSRTDSFLLEHLIRYLIKKLSERPTYAAILSESYSTRNQLALYILKNVDMGLIGMKDDFMHRVAKTFIWFGTWVGTNDTAYRHQFYYLINKIGNPEISDIALEFTFPPKKWYINVYQEGVNASKKLYAENTIPRHESSLLEEPCVVKKQAETIKKYTDLYGVK